MTTDQPPSPRIRTLTSSGMMIDPYGDHSFTELKAHYAAMIDSEPADIFIFEDMTMLADLRAALIECRRRKVKAAAVLTVDNRLLTDAELPADAALITLQSMGISAFGITADGEDVLKSGYERLASIAKIPLLVRGSEAAGTLAEKEFTLLPDMISGYSAYRPTESGGAEIMLASERQAFFLEPDTTELSEPIVCSDGMDEDLFAACQHSCDVLQIRLETPDDARAFAQNAHMASLPVMLSSDNDMSLILALMLYQGRALVDKNSALEEKTFEKAVDKYGAILY